MLINPIKFNKIQLNKNIRNSVYKTNPLKKDEFISFRSNIKSQEWDFSQHPTYIDLYGKEKLSWFDNLKFRAFSSDEKKRLKILLDNPLMTQLMQSKDSCGSFYEQGVHLSEEKYTQLQILLNNDEIATKAKKERTPYEVIQTLAETSSEQFENFWRLFKDDKICNFIKLEDFANLLSLEQNKQEEIIQLCKEDKVASFKDAKYIVFSEKIRDRYEKALMDGCEPKIASILANVSVTDICKLKDEDICELLKTLNAQDSKGIDVSENLSLFLLCNQGLDIPKLLEYIKAINFEKMTQNFPIFSSFNPMQKLNFCISRFESGKTEFDEKDLIFDDDFTRYLENNYVSSLKLNEIFNSHPLTKREIGSIPSDWLDKTDDNQEATKAIYATISDFQNDCDMLRLSQNLSKITNKKVEISSIGSGVFGTCFKITIDGKKSYCLKIFNDYKNENEFVSSCEFGEKIEPQIALFVNKHSNDYVKMYFGRVSPYDCKDGFLITQYLDYSTMPENTFGQPTDDYIIQYRDYKLSNFIMNKIIDFGGIQVYKRKGAKSL